MVLKQQTPTNFAKAKFENDVKTYGTQAFAATIRRAITFENDVKTYGTQAVYACPRNK